MQRGDDTGGFDDLQRRVVADDRRSGADPDARGRGGDRGEQDVRGGAGDTRIQVVLGEPVPGVAELFGALRERDARAQPVGRGLTLAERREVEDREGDGHELLVR